MTEKWNDINESYLKPLTDRNNAQLLTSCGFQRLGHLFFNFLWLIVTFCIFVSTLMG